MNLQVVECIAPVLVAIILMGSSGRWASCQVGVVDRPDCWRLRWGKSPFGLCPWGQQEAFLIQVEPYLVVAFLFDQLASLLEASFQQIDRLQPASCASSALPFLVVQPHLPCFTIYFTMVAICLRSDQSSGELKLVPFPLALRRYRPCSF